MIGLLALLAVAQAKPGVFILGVDGMDPVITRAMMAEGKLPNFQRLAEQGSFTELGTSNPPQSPVAWSSFVTGMNPGGHGIFDFVHRDPATYHPISSATPAPEPVEAVSLFGWTIPLSGGDMVNNRGGTPFWDYLHEAGVDVEVYRIPGNFPTPPSEAKVLSGMGTVDMRGGYGTYTWYTDHPVEKDDVKGDIQIVSLQDTDLDGVADTATGILRGPPDTFHLPANAVPGPDDYLAERVTFRVDPEHDTVLIEVGDEHVLLAEGEWSDWVHVTYEPLPGGLMAVDGMVRFYARSLRPDFEVYASPVNMAPANPAMPISSPEDWSAELAEDLGDFYTQGMPEETNALKDHVFDDDDYVRQVALVQDDTEAMMDLALDRFDPGDLTFVYFSDIDLQCHMLWRNGDPKYPDAPPHPAWDPAEGDRHAHDIEGYYENVDRRLGKVLDRVPEDTVVIVMSDHGFQPYTRKVNLNSWLRDEGYLVLKDGKRTGSFVAGDVDWSRTRAYAVGFNGLYINLKGREAEGIVDPAEVPALKAELTEKLEAWRDRVPVPDGYADFADVVGTEPAEAPEADTGEAADAAGEPAERIDERVVVRKVYDAAKVYSGDRAAEGPDLIVGYDVGYGGSDDTTLGEIPDGPLIEDNTSRWSGNHLMDPAVVPGVLFMNRKVDEGDHDLTDLTVSLLAWYGLPPGAGMVGTPFSWH